MGSDLECRIKKYKQNLKENQDRMINVRMFYYLLLSVSFRSILRFRPWWDNIDSLNILYMVNYRYFTLFLTNQREFNKWEKAILLSVIEEDTLVTTFDVDWKAIWWLIM